MVAVFVSLDLDRRGSRGGLAACPQNHFWSSSETLTILVVIASNQLPPTTSMTKAKGTHVPFGSEKESGAPPLLGEGCARPTKERNLRTSMKHCRQTYKTRCPPKLINLKNGKPAKPIHKAR